MNFFKKNAALTKTVITVFLFFAFFLIAFSSTKETEDTYPTDFTETTEFTEETVIEEEAAPSTPSSPAPTQQIVLGQSVDFKGVVFTLEKAYLYDGSDSTYDRPNPGMTYLVLDYKVENNTSEDIYAGDFSINVYANGRAVDSAYTEKNTYTSKVLLPSTYLNVTDSFEIPQGSDSFQVRVSCYATDANDDEETFVYNFTIS